MKRRRTPRNPSLLAGFALTVVAGLVFALNLTATPVVADVPFAALLVAAVAAVTLAAGIIQERRRGTAAGRGRVHSGVVALLGVLAIAALAAHQRFLSYRAEDARFSNDGVDLAATVYAPRGGGPHPGVAFVHGSGPETRKEYAFFARRFARKGFVALAYDKRGTGHSTGSLYGSDYRDYAEDAVAAVRYLASSDEVDGGCVGLVGFSEGEWVAPLATTLSDDVAFLIVIAPSGVSPAEQVNEEIAIRLRALDHAEADVRRAHALNERVFEYQRTGQAPDGLADELREMSSQTWFRDARDIPDELYPADEYRWWRSVMDFAPGPVWQQVDVPVLLLKGGKDPNSTADLARPRIETALRRGSGHAAEFIVFPEGDHSLLRWPLGERVPPPLFASGYLETMAGWASEQPCARA